MEIQTKQLCDDIKCQVCEYPDHNLKHTGKITDKLISCDYIQFGDYDNSCAVERANVRYLKENNLIEYEDFGGYGFIKAWILDTEENRELLLELEDYPVFDDDLLSQVEMEIEEEYIKDNDDIWRNTEQPLKDILDKLDMRCIIPEIYYQVKENLNMEFIVESGGVGYIDLSKMVQEYNLLLCDKFPYIKTFSAMMEAIENKPVFPLSYFGETAAEMKHNKQCGQNTYTQEEIAEIVDYCIELENILERIKGA